MDQTINIYATSQPTQPETSFTPNHKTSCTVKTHQQPDFEAQHMNVAPTLDYLLIERALLGGQPIDLLNAAEKDFCQKYKPVFDVGRLAFRMAQGYYAHSAAIEIAHGSHARALASETPLGQISSHVIRKDGTQHTFDLPHYLGQAHTNPEIVDELSRVWLVGSLLTVGDAVSNLTPQKRQTLKNVPIFELLYHLRNGVAHGNVFNFTKDGVNRLNTNPAHNKTAGVKSQTGAEFEIVAGSHGKPALHAKPVLFDFMGPGDVLDLLHSVEIYLTRIRERYAAGELDGLLC